ncbi:MAG: hypothetical protein ABIR94_17680 [Rubrivivax sp.]
MPDTSTGLAAAGLAHDIARPALANEHVQCNAAGQVVVRLKSAWRDGAAHIVMSPLEFTRSYGGG